MATHILEVIIKTTVDDALKGLDKFDVALGKVESEANGAFATSLKNIEKLLEQISASSYRTSLALTSNFAKIPKATNGAGDALQKMGKKANNTGQAMSALNNIVRDAPFGIIGIGNNITQLSDALLGASIAGQVFGFGLSLLVTGLTALSQKYGSVSIGVNTLLDLYTDAEKAQLKYTKSIAGAGDAMTKAVADVTELRINIGLAKEGFLQKNDVVKQYNASIGKTTGSVKSLDEAEKALAKNAEQYIKFTLLKAAAQVALGEAAKKAFEAEKSRQRSDRESVDFIFSGLKRSGDTAVQNVYKKNAAKNREVVAKEFEKDQQQFEDIAAALQKQAAIIAKNSGFKFFDPKELGPKEKSVRTLADVLKDLEKDLTGLDVAFIAIGGNVQSLAADKLKRLEKAFQDVADFGVRPGSAVFDALNRQVEALQNSLNKTKVTLQIPITIGKLPSITADIVSQTAAAVKAGAETLGLELSAFNKAVSEILYTSTIEAITAVSQAIGNAVATGNTQKILGAFVGGIAGLLEKLGKLLIVQGLGIEAFKTSLQSLQGVPAIIAGGAMVAAAAAFRAAIPSFATGGGVFGPTLAMIGDNPGREEYVIPSEVLDKMGGNGGGFIARTEISGTNLAIIIERALRQQGRANG